jgi:hypothetical protein
MEVFLSLTDCVLFTDEDPEATDGLRSFLTHDREPEISRLVPVSGRFLSDPTFQNVRIRWLTFFGLKYVTQNLLLKK